MKAADDETGRTDLAADAATLRTELLARMQADQDARHAHAARVEAGSHAAESWAAAVVVDADNLALLLPLIERHGWLGSDLVGADGAHACWLLVQHAPPEHQARWLPLMRDAVSSGLADPRDLAYLEDRVAMHDDRPQRYGTQYSCLAADGPMRLWPVADLAGVDIRRDRLGLPEVPADAVATMWTAEDLAAHGRVLAPGTG